MQVHWGRYPPSLDRTSTVARLCHFCSDRTNRADRLGGLAAALAAEFHFPADEKTRSVCRAHHLDHTRGFRLGRLRDAARVKAEIAGMTTSSGGEGRCRDRKGREKFHYTSRDVTKNCINVWLHVKDGSRNHCRAASTRRAHRASVGRGVFRSSSQWGREVMEQ